MWKNCSSAISNSDDLRGKKQQKKGEKAQGWLICQTFYKAKLWERRGLSLGFDR